MSKPTTKLLQYALAASVVLPLFYVNFLMYMSGNILMAISMLGLLVLGIFIYASRRGYVYRYLFPGLLGFLIFVIFPLIYTFWISFHKYDARNLLTQERVETILLSETFEPQDAPGYAYKIYPSSTPGNYQLTLTPKEATETTDQAAPIYISPELTLPLENGPQTFDLTLTPAPPDAEALSIGDITRGKLHVMLRQVTLQLPDEQIVALSSLREFSTQKPVWEKTDDGGLRNLQTGILIHPQSQSGFYETADGERVGIGFRTWAGGENYSRILQDNQIKQPFIRIFFWTFAFAFLSMLTTFALGMFLAVLLEWEGLKGRTLYRTLLILPYAVPAFLSILTFQGMFNQEFGAVNEFLTALFHIAPEWNTNPWLAKTMILIVNLWLGYPYMMIICTGNLQSISKSIYEASAIDGSTPWANFKRLTLPLVLPPMIPVLIASFAFNFNNFNLIFLLTGGSPKMVGGAGIAGETDILVTYTFNLAFKNSGADYGLASAIATILFVIVGILAWLNLKKTQGSAS